jgi:hypothetical protein
MPMTGVEEDMGRGREQGFLEKATSYGKRLLGREDYSSVRQEEDGQSERIRRQKETPSSIYAHKTVEVRFAPLQLPVGI